MNWLAQNYLGLLIATISPWLPWIFAALVFIISLWRPTYGVAALIILWPSYLLRTTIAGIPTTALELSIYAATLTIGIHVVRKTVSLKALRLPRMWLILFVLWSLAWITSTLFATDHHAALGGLKAWWFDATLFGMLVLLITKTAHDKIILVKAALLSGAIVALAGFVQEIAFRSTLQDGRLSSFFHPVANYAAMYLSPLLIFGAMIMWSKVLRPMWWIAVALIAVALLLTISFAGFFATAVGLVILWWWLPSGKAKQRIALIGAGIIIVFGLVITQTRYFTEHFNSTDRSSSLVRSQIWVTSWALIQHHSIVGIGPDTFEPNYRAEIPKHYWPPLEWLVAQPHNLYLALWLETGLLGLLSFAMFMIWWIRQTWRRAQDGDARPLGLACLAAVIVILSHGLFDTPVFKNDLVLEITFFLLLPWLASGLSHKTNTPR